MKSLQLVPDGWPCKLGEHVGLFVYGANDGTLGLSSTHGDVCMDNGEAFWGGTQEEPARAELIVQPVKAVWVEVDE